MWPSLPFQSEETNVPEVEEQLPVSKINEEVMKVAKRDEEVPMGRLYFYVSLFKA